MRGRTDVIRINCSFLLTFLGISMFLSFKGSFGESSLPFPLLATLLRFFSALIFFFLILVSQLIPWEKQKLIENLMNLFSPFKISFIAYVFFSLNLFIKEPLSSPSGKQPWKLTLPASSPTSPKFSFTSHKPQKVEGEKSKRGIFFFS